MVTLLRTARADGLVVRDPDQARAAHLLRRTSLRVDPDRIDALAGQGWDDAVAAVLADGERPVEGEPPRSEDWGDTVVWWLDRMVEPGSGLRERMAWFWHTLLTTSAAKVSAAGLIRDQLIMLRADALGDYRSLLHRFITSGALLEFLDASYSIASNPNENLGRELMELFTLGRGNYREDDVRSAARALAGWVVEDGAVEWRRENAFVAPLLFRGVQDEWDTTKIVDHLCDQPETARTIGARVWTELAGAEPTPETADELGRWWQDRDLAILPLIERVLSEPAVRDARLNRPRSGLEWYAAFRSVTGVVSDGPWQLEDLGQIPYLPPNVGGWPAGTRWLTAGSMLPRASFAFDLNDETLRGGRSGTTDDILNRCGLHEVSSRTLAAIDGVTASDELSPEAAHLTRWRLALSSPEFSLS